MGVLVVCGAAEDDDVVATDAVAVGTVVDRIAVVSPSVLTPDVPEQPATNALTASSPTATDVRFRIPAPGSWTPARQASGSGWTVLRVLSQYSTTAS